MVNPKKPRGQEISIKRWQVDNNSAEIQRFLDYLSANDLVGLLLA